eukprot:TRINITY_DN33631_c1_g1_i1.p3 TRINITY_DN33631_c1_g1~~TRINITY_DN33631_c1_g1_i1.p3  ORF type:complete len:148 (-),score=28.74 TRINITY_DN33631_c1_g1_i1:18-416(-)
MPRPVDQRKIVKKRRKDFHRVHSDRYACISKSWRKPRGIDGVWRRRFRDYQKLPNIGYGSNKKTRHILPNGFRKFVVNNLADLEILLMHNRSYCAEIGHKVSARNRIAIVKRAKELDVKVLNATAKLASKEN